VGVSSQVPYSWTEFVDITVDMSVVVALFMPFNRYAPFKTACPEFIEGFNRFAPFKLNTKAGFNRSRVPIVPNVRGIKTKLPCFGNSRNVEI
jgi:hypothetical protein